jgi:hypothetical protein
MERQGDDTFHVHIRIGIHSGDAIVEKDDVYGDIVNVAARVEAVGKGNEILLSQATAAYINDEYAFNIKRKGWFVPKGKKNKFYVYTCDWKYHPLLIDEIIKSNLLPVSRRQKLELGVYFAATLGVLYFIYHNYLRYLISDAEDVALRYLNFSSILQEYTYFAGTAGVVLLIMSVIFLRLHKLPLGLMRLIKGGFLFSAGFIVFYLVAQYAPLRMENKWDEVLDSSYHEFVQVLEDKSNIFEEPSLSGQALMQIPSGHLLLQKESRLVGDLTWNRVLVGAERTGWIVHVSPPQMGVPEKEVSRAYKFHLRYKDLYTIVFGLFCFIFGFWRFRLRPI